MSGANVAVWRWDRGEPVPDARLVVAAPGELDMVARMRLIDAAREGVVVVWSLENADRLKHLVVKERLIPALHVRTQADLARLPDLLTVKAERRAIVLSLGEAIDLLGAWFCDRCRGGPWGPGAEDDPLSNAMGGKPWRECCSPKIDLLLIAGFDEPLHVGAVRSAVEQCRAAGVPVVFAGWGAWCPWDQMPRDEGGEFPWGERDGLDRRIAFGLPFYRAARAIPTTSALLDGVPVCELPEWLR